MNKHNPPQPSPPLWKASVVVPKERASDAAALLELTPVPAAQAVMSAEDPFEPDATVEALYEAAPDAAFLSRLIGAEVTVEPLPDQDWIRASQEGLPPVRAGRFFVYGAHDAGKVPSGVIPIRIEAGMAFGTGHHETTALCLRALSDLARVFSSPVHGGGAERSEAEGGATRSVTRSPLRLAATRRSTSPVNGGGKRILDLGCGTGVLAIAAAKLWKTRVLATDIDPEAVAVAEENARINDAAPLVQAAVADGMDHPAIRNAAPFDLIVANILAQPLTRLAPGVAAALAPAGVAVLSGLLHWQEKTVLGFYRAQGLVLKRSLRDGPWSALVLMKSAARDTARNHAKRSPARRVLERPKGKR